MAKRTVVELEELRARLRDAEETLAAIRNGEVDSLVVSGPHGDQIFSLKGAEQPYRVFVEQMLEGAVWQISRSCGAAFQTAKPPGKAAAG